MEDILKAILENAMKGQAAPQQRQQQSDPIADLIRGIAGGGARQAPVQPQAPAGIDINDLIGGILGGSQRQGTQQSGAIGDLIGGILGGGSRSRSANPIAQILAQKTGLPLFVAEAAVAYFMSKMIGRIGGGGSARRSASPVPEEYGIGRAKPQPDTMDLDDMLDMMDDEEMLDSSIDQSGMAEEFAEQAGIEKGSALDAIKSIVKILGGKRAIPEPVDPREADMKDLLDNW